MKIFFRISKLGFGGAEQVFLSIAKELKKIVEAEISFIVDSKNGENVKTAEELGFRVISLEANRTMSSIFPLKHLLDSEKPEIMVSAYTDTNAACLISKVLSKSHCKVIVSEHASLKEHWGKKSILKRYILRFYVSYIYQLASKVICVSNGLKNQVVSLLGSNTPVETIYNPVRYRPYEKIVERNKERRPILQLLAVGRITEQKDYSTLINAIPKILKYREVSLTIVGGIFCEKEYSKLKALITSLGIESCVHFVGYTDNVAEYYKSADIFVLSSAWEGFGNVIVEAMAFGLPVVATNCNYGPSEILEDGRYGRLAPVSDSYSLAKAILEEAERPLINRSDLISRSTEFSEENIASQYFTAIKSTLDEKI
ncbi:glycosyltransferase [Grimontia marina]|uniref:GalNAc-alpha-(1->4)-GalNAc-alpha-(1->3)-diNAcBac-PP-undecaprenol alpha-1,4-N-acetyl-D-galactosaminyltransferase n=1 Tax=Grimontia marina TaxID=646534 RepID=A0A128ETX0_9GAMM|nr:glycosyltransferase [Grimontia marina]CZF77481.1 GalNAc-alpha-(1->4)-GalNAc-alpha-(1->3)-diNAcBac-PP-undecaprenol alpha-1,4-N-acetyl-D-galactosaminyltransferase [Grimontia marina]